VPWTVPGQFTFAWSDIVVDSRVPWQLQSPTDVCDGNSPTSKGLGGVVNELALKSFFI
jgi:hypothetical protein